MPFDHLSIQHPLAYIVLKETFIPVPLHGSRQQNSQILQYYHLLPQLDDFFAFVKAKFRPNDYDSWMPKTANLSAASYIDINYDKKNEALEVYAFWGRSMYANLWTEIIERRNLDDSLEVGVLMNEMPTQQGELSMSGFLTVIGKDDSPSQLKLDDLSALHSFNSTFHFVDQRFSATDFQPQPTEPTVFSFPSRHHSLSSATFTTSFKQPTGLHPTLSLSLSSSALHPPLPSCSLHTYLTLPSAIFLDRYQLLDTLFLKSHNLIALHSLSGETDLEAPDWVLSRWGSAALLEISPSFPSPSSNLTVTIPLHLRYLPPAHNTSGLVPFSLPYPSVFWACPAPTDLAPIIPQPFDRTGLSYDSLFDDRTLFYHIAPSPVPSSSLVRGGVDEDDRLLVSLQVPVLDLDLAGWVEWGTVAAVVLGTGWIAWKLVVAAGLFGEEEERKVERKEERKEVRDARRREPSKKKKK